MDRPIIICSTNQSYRGQFIPWQHKFENWEIAGLLKVPDKKIRILVVQDEQSKELQKSFLEYVLVDFEMIRETNHYQIIKVKSFTHFNNHDKYTDLTCNPWSEAI